jgi:hypothetical protein
VRKPDPIGIEERAGAFETSLQIVGAIEIERHRFDRIAKWIRARWMSRQRSDATALRQEHARDISARVPGCPGDNVEVILWHSAVSIESRADPGFFATATFALE